MYPLSLSSKETADTRWNDRLELLSSHPGLQVLKLNNNGMGPTGGATIAGALLANAQKAKAEGRKPALRTIICGSSPLPLGSRTKLNEWRIAGRNRLENGSAQAFADAFAALGSLEEVRMPQNGIRMEGIEAIVKGLRKNPNLKVLDLQDNTATERGSRAIAAALPLSVFLLSSLAPLANPTTAGPSSTRST